MKNNYPWYLTLGPVGYFKAPGTCASAIGLPVVLIIRYAISSFCWYSAITMFVTVVSLYLIDQKLPSDKVDPREIVLDEIVGLMWTFSLWPLSLMHIFLLFGMFRFFDVTKLGIGWLEKFPGAFGIVADDIGAGVMAVATLIILIA